MQKRIIEINRQLTSNKYFPIIVLISINLIIASLIVTDYGESWDEAPRYRYAKISLNAYLNGNVVILSIDPTTINTREIRLLEKEAREVEPWVFVKLPEDLLEILRFIYEHNALGSKPNYTATGKELRISKPTVSKKIKLLVNTGYITENVRGRRKVLELTQKGLRLFVK